MQDPTTIAINVDPDEVEVEITATVTVREAYALKQGGHPTNAYSLQDAADDALVEDPLGDLLESYGKGQLLLVDGRTPTYAVMLACGDMAWADEVNVGTLAECAAACAGTAHGGEDVTLTHSAAEWALMSVDEIRAEVQAMRPPFERELRDALSAGDGIQAGRSVELTQLDPHYPEGAVVALSGGLFAWTDEYAHGGSEELAAKCLES